MINFNTTPDRIYNFGAGPSTLPTSVLQQVQDELLNWRGKGISILELGHRTTEFVELLNNLETLLRKLMNIPENYKVLFLGNAARLQFSMIPMNLLNRNDEAGYIVSGIWSKLALLEAQKLKSAYCVASSAEEFICAPDMNNFSIRKNTKYIYYTPNETINGVSLYNEPEVGNTALIADLTSCMLARPIDITKYALVFAGAQKNIAGAGLTIVIIREDLLEFIPEDPIATMLDYRVHASNNSLYATPPVFNCYVAEKTLNWILECGINEIYDLNRQKAQKLYDFIDSSSGYYCNVVKENRSDINVCFYLHRKDLEDKFLSQALTYGLYALKGHRKVGGFRASLYNALPLEAVDKLINFMQEFAQENDL